MSTPEPEKLPNPTRNSPMQEKEDEKIVEEINLGGFKYLAEKNTTVRILWASVIVVFLALTVYQISEQIAKYVSNPISTNVEVEYPQKINFPAIAICNNNQFRQSYIVRKEFQDLVLVDGYTVSDLPYFDQVIEAIHERSAMEFLRNSSHELSNLLASCILPNGTACHHREMWTQMWTVNGICWALNVDQENPFEITNSGPNHGLRLVLNAESYERTDTCGKVLNSQAETGFKILIFNQTDRPITTSEGVSVSPGMSVNIPFRIKRRSKLPGPNCREESDQARAAVRNLTSPDNIRACLGRIFHEKFEEKCGCSIRGLFTDEHDIENECDVEMYFSCVLPYQRSLHADMIAEIGQQCLPACETMEYIPMQDISGLPKNLFPPLNDENSLITKEEVKVQTVEKRFVGLAENGSRLFERVDVNCANSTYITKDYTNRTIEKTQYVAEKRSRLDLVESKTFETLLNRFHRQKLQLQRRGWPWQEKEQFFLPIADMIIDRNESCTEVMWIFKNESEAFGNLKTIDVLVRQRPADMVKWPLLKRFKFHIFFEKFLDGSIWKVHFAELVQKWRIVAFFHEEYQKYWSQPIQDFLYEAAQTFFDERDELAEILKTRFGDDNNTSPFHVSAEDVDTCIYDELDDLISKEFEEFRAQAQTLSQAFDAAFKDHLGDFLRKTQINEDFERANMAVVNIYLQSNTIESWTQNEDYTFWTLACDIGGALGLFLGASVVTILEIIYVVYQHKTRNKQQQAQKRRPREHDPLHGEVKMKPLKNGAP